MPPVRLRDRDAILTREGLILRVFGYSHPQSAYICDAEYALAKIFQSKDPRALRNGSGSPTFYKFYDDEGWQFIFNRYPQYTVFHEMLGQRVVGINSADIAETRRPQQRLEALASSEPADKLHAATLRVLTTMLERTGLAMEDFGVFGSMLHGFHHPDYSDIDLVVYGRKPNAQVREAIAALYAERGSGFRNEFETDAAITGKKWRFQNFSQKEFLWHQRRKLIYGLYADAAGGRTIKAEFEPVKDWSEIFSEYSPEARILRKDWVRLKARVVADGDAPFIPSVYGIETLEVLSGSRTALEAVRVVSFMEEFRQQAQKDEVVLVEGGLEEVVSPKGSFHQIALTYCPRYYEQVLKVPDLSL